MFDNLPGRRPPQTNPTDAAIAEITNILDAARAKPKRLLEAEAAVIAAIAEQGRARELMLDLIRSYGSATVNHIGASAADIQEAEAAQDDARKATSAARTSRDKAREAWEPTWVHAINGPAPKGYQIIVDLLRQLDKALAPWADLAAYAQGNGVAVNRVSRRAAMMLPTVRELLAAIQE